jgi:hypothetical protein
VVVADPEPDDSFALKQAERSMVARYANGIHGTCLADPLELGPGCLGLSVKASYAFRAWS